MRHVPTDKHTIAWFKLAECISRGEREKAYGVYRLLAHSLADQAYAHQLEGDLLRCFDDTRAFEKYRIAAQLYYQDQRWLQAAGIAEHLKAFNELTPPIRELMIDVHERLKNTPYVSQLLKELVLCYIEQQQHEKVALRLKHLCTITPHKKGALYAKEIVVAAIEQSAPADQIKSWLSIILEYLVTDDDSSLDTFMQELSVVSPAYHRIAHQLLQKAKK